MKFEIGDKVNYKRELWTIFYIVDHKYRPTQYVIEKGTEQIYGCYEEEFDNIINCPEYFNFV